MTAITIGILETGKLDRDLYERFGAYDSMFERLMRSVAPEMRFRTYSVVSDAFPDSPEECDGWLVTGSRHGVYDALPWMAPLQAFLRDAVAADRPIVGVCFGHQILAAAMGGVVEKSSKGWGVGRHEYALTDAAARAGLTLPASETAPLALFAMHQDQVTSLPEGATVLAESEFCPAAALAYGPSDDPIAVSIQPHPEFDADFMTALTEKRRAGGMDDAQADRAIESLAGSVNARALAEWFAKVLTRRQRHAASS